MSYAWKEIVLTKPPIFHLISDIHLEHYPCMESVEELVKAKPKLSCLLEAENSNKILLLPGDIGYPKHESYWKFLGDLGSRYKRVVFTTGNHEYYGSDISSVDEVCRKKATGNIHFLQKDALYADGVRYLGATLWTDIPYRHQAFVQRGMMDYHIIMKNKTSHGASLIDVTDTISIHHDHVDWINKELEKDSKTPTVVLTHHLPSDKLVAPEYKDSIVTHAFYTDCESLMKPPIQVWVAGHTHKRMYAEINGVSVRVNPMGYHKENPEGVSVVEFEM